MYEWLKAFHLIAVMSWMAGLLYLPRLFVYHSDAEKGSDKSETFKVMERRLLKAIMTPAMIVSWGLGLALIWLSGWDWVAASGWFHIKVVLVVVLSGFHMYLASLVKCFARDGNDRPARYFRIINEFPTVIMIAVVILAVLKPF